MPSELGKQCGAESVSGIERRYELGHPCITNCEVGDRDSAGDNEDQAEFLVGSTPAQARCILDAYFIAFHTQLLARRRILSPDCLNVIGAVAIDEFILIADCEVSLRGGE